MGLFSMGASLLGKEVAESTASKFAARGVGGFVGRKGADVLSSQVGQRVLGPQMAARLATPAARQATSTLLSRGTTAAASRSSSNRRSTDTAGPQQPIAGGKGWWTLQQSHTQDWRKIGDLSVARGPVNWDLPGRGLGRALKRGAQQGFTQEPPEGSSYKGGNSRSAAFRSYTFPGGMRTVGMAPPRALGTGSTMPALESGSAEPLGLPAVGETYQPGFRMGTRNQSEFNVSPSGEVQEGRFVPGTHPADYEPTDPTERPGGMSPTMKRKAGMSSAARNQIRSGLGPFRPGGVGSEQTNPTRELTSGEHKLYRNDAWYKSLYGENNPAGSGPMTEKDKELIFRNDAWYKNKGA